MPSSEDLPDSGIELGSPPLQVDSLPAELPGKDHAGESPLLSRSGGEKGLRGSGAGDAGRDWGRRRRGHPPQPHPAEVKSALTYNLDNLG